MQKKVNHKCTLAEDDISSSFYFAMRIPVPNFLNSFLLSITHFLQYIKLGLGIRFALKKYFYNSTASVLNVSMGFLCRTFKK